MKYTIKKNSFVAYNSVNNDGTEKFIVAIGHCTTTDEIQFIEIEYTDEGEVIHFFDTSNEEFEEKFNALKNVSSEENCFNEYVEFPGNDKLKALLQSFKEQGSDFEHKLNCTCAACCIYKFTIYRGDTIDRVIGDFSRI